MKHKKQSWIKKNWLDWIFAPLILLILFMILIYGIQNSTSYICSKNPERCVCKTFEKQGMNGYRKECLLKTQVELDIDDCNNNPREDDKCKCEEEITDSIIVPASCNIKGNISCSKTAQMCSGELICSEAIDYYSKNITIQYCFKSRPKTECEKGNPD